MAVNNMSLPIYFSVNEEMSDKDNRFIKVSIDVLHTGLNFNGSIFSKEVVDKNIDTIKNTPILGFIRELPFDGKDFKGHEYVITKTEDGVKRKYIGEAFGMIPESCNPRWITKMTDSGVEREFLQVDGLLWTKFQDSTDIMLKDTEKPQSMELSPDSISGYEDDDGNFVFENFSFDGCCILGSSVAPAMENSIITIDFTMSDFVRNIQSELIDKYNTFTKMVNEKNNDGGIEDMSKTDFTQTVLQQFEDISAMVRQQETYTDRWGDEVPRYYAVDIQEDEVIVVDRNQGYNYFGFSFAMNGDKAEIDFTSGKRKKLRYENYEDGSSSIEGAFNFGSHITEIEDVAFAKVEEANAKVEEAKSENADFETKVNELTEAKETAEANYTQIKTEFDEIKTEFDEMKPKYEEFVAAEQARRDAEIEEAKEAEFAKYETVLASDANFEALKERKAEMTVKEIESECAILYARKNLAQTDFSKGDAGVMTAGIATYSSNDGFIETKYGLIPVSN